MPKRNPQNCIYYDEIPDDHRCYECGKGKDEATFKHYNGYTDKTCSYCHWDKKKNPHLYGRKPRVLAVKIKIDEYFRDNYNG